MSGLNKEMKIEEMAKDIIALVRVEPLSRALASILYDKGYRKASNVAMEVIGEVEDDE